jgi:3-hexulose-6-phosphate synthase
MWGGHIVADMKINDGAVNEVDMTRQAGADAVTILGSAPIETVNLAIQRCEQVNLMSMIDLLGVEEPLDVFRPLLHKPGAAVLHLGRDEENTSGKLIQYRQINRIHSKYSTLIAAAGGVGLKEAHSAIFNGVNIVIVNIVHPGDGWNGISTQEDIPSIVNEFLETMA